MQVRSHLVLLLLCFFAIVSTSTIALGQSTSLTSDSDLDGLSNADEISIYGTDPQLADTDGDTLVDGVEVHIYHTDPRISDAQQSDPVIIPANDGLTSIGTYASANVPLLSGDGRFIAYEDWIEENDQQIDVVRIYDRTNGTFEIISELPESHRITGLSALSNDGRYAIIDGSIEIGQCPNGTSIGLGNSFLFDRQTGIARTFLERTQSNWFWVPAIAGDSSTIFIAYTEYESSSDYCDRSDPRTVIQNELYAYDIATDTLTALPFMHEPGLEQFRTLTVSDDGQILALQLGFEETDWTESNFIFDRTTNTLTQIPLPDGILATYPLISGDGSTVAFDSYFYAENREVTYGFYIYDIQTATGEFVPIAGIEHAGIRLMDLSADGSILVSNNEVPFMSEPPRPRRSAFVYNRNSGAITHLPLPENTTDHGLVWGISSDGATVLYEIQNCTDPNGCNPTRTYLTESHAYIYEYTPPEIVETVPPGGMTTTTLSQARGWSKLQWMPVDGAAWYHVWLGDYANYTFDQWYEAAAVCDLEICSTPEEFWLSNGTYHWWMSHWSNAAPNYTDAYSETVFGVNVLTPDVVERLATSQSSSAGARSHTILTWESDPKANWYRLYIGDSQTATFDNWYRAADVCDTSICFAEVNLPVGSHEWWMNSWGPGGYSPWNTEAFIVTVSGE